MLTSNIPLGSYVFGALRFSATAAVVVASLLLAAPDRADAHAAGAQDPYGCHANTRKTHDYHCHRGQYSGLRFTSKSDMLKKKKAGMTAEEIRAAEPGYDDKAKDNESTDEAAVSSEKKESGKSKWNLLNLGRKEPAPEPSTDGGNTLVPKGVEQRLRTLKNLHEDGLITDQEYERKKAEILGDL